MAGLVPAIHAFLYRFSKDVDARHKAGHDEKATADAARSDASPAPAGQKSAPAAGLVLRRIDLFREFVAAVLVDTGIVGRAYNGNHGRNGGGDGFAGLFARPEQWDRRRIRTVRPSRWSRGGVRFDA